MGKKIVLDRDIGVPALFNEIRQLVEDGRDALRTNLLVRHGAEMTTQGAPACRDVGCSPKLSRWSTKPFKSRLIDWTKTIKFLGFQEGRIGGAADYRTHSP
jgi:hypothetical protein